MNFVCWFGVNRDKGHRLCGRSHSRRRVGVLYLPRRRLAFGLELELGCAVSIRSAFAAKIRRRISSISISKGTSARAPTALRWPRDLHLAREQNRVFQCADRARAMTTSETQRRPWWNHATALPLFGVPSAAAAIDSDGARGRRRCCDSSIRAACRSPSSSRSPSSRFRSHCCHSASPRARKEDYSFIELAQRRSA
jgi:hypothetical protein